MVNLMLYDLHRPVHVCFDACLHLQGLILHLDSLIPSAFTGTAEQWHPLPGVVRTILFQNDRVEHHGIRWARPLSSRKAMMRFRTPIIFAAISTYDSRWAIKVNPDIFFCCVLGFTREEYRGVHQLLNHRFAPQFLMKIIPQKCWLFNMILWTSLAIHTYILLILIFCSYKNRFFSDSLIYFEKNDQSKTRGVKIATSNQKTSKNDSAHPPKK